MIRRHTPSRRRIGSRAVGSAHAVQTAQTVPAVQALQIRAFAKINLTLRVFPVRPDGYHELRTVYQTIDLHDTLSVTATAGPFTIECDGPVGKDDPDRPDAPPVPTDERNLVWKAAAYLWAAAGRSGTPRETRVRIVKRIPLEAGLGGGSSDAASALRALAVLWRVPADLDVLSAIAREIGADVPFFLRGGTVLGVGRGDVLFRLPDAGASWVALAKPSFGVSTTDAYGWWDAMPRASDHGTNPAIDLPTPLGTIGIPPSELCNDLQALVAEHHPEILRMVAALQKAGASYAAMSGSGSAVFGLFSRRAAADRAAAGLRSRTVQAWVVRFLSPERLQSASRPIALGPTRPTRPRA